MTKTGSPDTASSVTAALGELIEGLSAAVANLEERLAAVEAAVQQITERVTLDGILDCLNHEHRRATYGAVGQALGFPRDRAARMTGELMYERSRSPRNSWVVSRDTGLPKAMFTSEQKHPALLKEPHVITTGDELLKLLGRPAEE